MIDIKGLDKAKVIAALYDNAKPLGLGILHYNPLPLTEAEAQFLAGTSLHFDYLHGRVMKVHLAGDTFEEGMYDRDNGQDAAQKAIDALRKDVR